MAQRPPPVWLPIRQLPFIASLLGDLLKAAEAQWHTLRQGRDAAGVLDEYVIRHILEVYSREREDLPVFDAQLQRWKSQSLTAAQEAEISRLDTQLARLREVVEAIMELAVEEKGRLTTSPPAQRRLETEWP